MVSPVPGAQSKEEVAALQDEIKALEAKLAKAREEDARLSDPDGDYIEEIYEEEILDDDGYVIEEVLDGDDEIIEIIEYDEDDEYEEVVEDDAEETVPQRPAAPSASSETPKGASSPRNAGGGPPRAAAPSSAKPLDFSSIKLRTTGITLAEDEADSPYTNKGPPPKAQPALDPPKAVPARDAPQTIDQPKNFLQGVQDAEDRAAEAEAKALKAVEDEEDNKTRKKWIPMKERNPEKYPKTSIDVREATLKKTTKLQPLPFKPRQYPSIPASPTGQETPMEKILGPYLYYNSKLDRLTTTSAMAGQDIVLLYFGAAWMSGCKVFHQHIIDFYKLTNKDCNLECVYVSADRTLFEFKDVYAKFPFLAIPTGTVDLKNQMTKDFDIRDLPCVVVLNAQTGHLITADGVEGITSLPPRDRDLSQNLVNEWKHRKATPVTRESGGGTNETATTDDGKQEQAPAGAPARKGAAVGRKERKGDRKSVV